MSNLVPTQEQRAAAATKTFGDWRSFASDSIRRWVETGVNADDHTGVDLGGADGLADLLAEREARHLAAIAKLRKALASVCIDILTSPAVTDTMWCHDSDLCTTNDYIAGVLGFDTVDPDGSPSQQLLWVAAPAEKGGAL